MDRLISLLAALVGLIALAGAVVVQLHNDETARGIASDLAEMKVAISLLGQQQSTKTEPTPAAPVHDGVPEALLALQTRIAALEKAATQTPAVSVTPDSAASPSTASAITAKGPTTDCIPLDQRFMATTGESYPICRTEQVIKVTDIQASTVILEGGGAINSGGFSKLGFTGCTVMVFSVDTAGFAEMRVTCQ